MTPTVSIGMDLARRTAHQAVIVAADGTHGAVARKVETSAGSLDAMVKAAGGPAGCRVVLEPTGMAWIPIATYLTFLGCEVVGVDTRAAHQFRKFFKRTVKSDRVDAEALARMPAANPDHIRPAAIPSKAQFTLQRLVRLRNQLVDDRADEIRRLFAALEPYVPDLPRVFGVGNALTDVKRFLLHHFLHPKVVLEVGVEGMLQALKKQRFHGKNHEPLLKRWHQAAAKAWSIWEPLEAAGLSPVDFTTAQLEVNLHLARIDALGAHIVELAPSIDAAYDAIDPKHLLETLPGIAKTIAPAIRAFVGDIRRFPNVNSFVSYFGLAPLKNQSGNSDRTGQRISKAGNALIRRYLFLAADNARRSDLKLAAFYHSKRNAGWHHTKIVTALANKLARRIYAVLKREAGGDTSGYKFYDDHGTHIDAKQSTRETRKNYPSINSIRRQKGRDSQAKRRGQSLNSPAPDTESPATANPTPLGPHAKTNPPSISVVSDDGDHPQPNPSTASKSPAEPLPSLRR